MRRLVVCCDGTWNTPDRKSPSNVVRMARAVLPGDVNGIDQVVFYDPGVGTDNVLDKLTGGAFGVGLSRNVGDAYLFLLHNYVEGDELYFFGFSRGAFTVRSAAGLIRKVGILRKEHADRVPEAWIIYRKRDAGPDTDEAKVFREHYSRFPVPIHFMGVWDTVGALGIPGPLNFIGRRRFGFHNVALSRSVDFAYQALAIDEKRLFFKPTIWEQNPDAESQILEQAWFPGVHTDVGGGEWPSGLADGAFRWMAEKAEAVGLALDGHYVDTVTAPDPLGPLHESRKFPYTLIPVHHRPIGAGVPKDQSVHLGESQETLDASALARYEADPTYRPPELVKYLRAHSPLDGPPPLT